MKTAIFLSFALLSALCTGTSYAQPAALESVFPMVGFSFGYGDASSANINALEGMMNEAGLNALYNADPSTYLPMTGKTGYPDYHEPLEKFFGNRNEPLHCTEMRFFLVSKLSGVKDPNKPESFAFSLMDAKNKRFAYDINRNWGIVTGSRNATTNEWYIPQTETSSEILSGLQVNGGDLSNGDENNNMSYVVDKNSAHALCDFIYRIDKTKDYSTFTTNPIIYKVRYTVKIIYTDDNWKPIDDDGNSNNGVQYRYDNDYVFDQEIKLGDFEKLTAVNQTPERAKELANIKRYANNDYAVLRSVIPDANSTTWTHMPRKADNRLAVSIECKLLRDPDGSKGIYVRGLRIRSDSCDKLLKGELDGGLKTIFNDIKTNLTDKGAWSKEGTFIDGWQDYDQCICRFFVTFFGDTGL